MGRAWARVLALLLMAPSLSALPPGKAPSARAETPGVTVVGLRSLGPFPGEWLEEAREGLGATFAVRVVLLPREELPATAWYEPRRRYRADLLLDHLRRLRPHEVAKVVGLTRADISVTKGDIPDWGIFGLGLLGGDACVVSTFRLGASKVGREKFMERLVKVVNHEVGHTLGLDHCATPQCLMEDARGTIRTVDAESGRLCARCEARIGALARKVDSPPR